MITQVNVFAPALTGDVAPVYGWCRKSECAAYTTEVRKQFLRGHFASLTQVAGVGPKETLEVLAELGGHPEKQRALLKAGFLFPYAQSRHGNWRPGWADWPTVWELYSECLAEAGLSQVWHYSCNQVIPCFEETSWGNDRLSRRQFETKSALAEALDSLVDELPHHWVAVQWNFTLDTAQDYVPAMLAELDEEALQAKAALAALKARLAAEANARRARQKPAKKPPREGAWARLPNSELSALVWQKPLRDLGADFGISDVAVKKRCKTRNIATPPRGYWLSDKAAARAA